MMMIRTTRVVVSDSQNCVARGRMPQTARRRSSLLDLPCLSQCKGSGEFFNFGTTEYITCKWQKSALACKGESGQTAERRQRRQRGGRRAAVLQSHPVLQSQPRSISLLFAITFRCKKGLHKRVARVRAWRSLGVRCMRFHDMFELQAIPRWHQRSPWAPCNMLPRSRALAEPPLAAALVAGTPAGLQAAQDARIWLPADQLYGLRLAAGADALVRLAAGDAGLVAYTCHVIVRLKEVSAVLFGLTHSFPPPHQRRWAWPAAMAATTLHRWSTCLQPLTGCLGCRRARQPVLMQTHSRRLGRAWWRRKCGPHRGCKRAQWRCLRCCATPLHAPRPASACCCTLRSCRTAAAAAKLSAAAVRRWHSDVLPCTCVCAGGQA